MRRPLLPRRVVPRTRRGRLIAGLVALLTVACAAVGLVTYFAVQGSLSRELNNQLQTATGLAYNCWQRVDNSAQPGPRQADGQDSVSSAHGDSASHASTAAWTGNPTSSVPSSMADCQGLGEDTFIGFYSDDAWKCKLIGPSEIKLTPADEKALLSITPVPAAPPGEGAGTRP